MQRVGLIYYGPDICSRVGSVGLVKIHEGDRNSIAFGKSTSQRIYREQHTPKIGWKLHKYRLKHALHTLDDHFR